MTIDSGWCKTAKTLCREAFRAERPEVLRAQPYVVFIDGQINLMKADWICTWAEFLRTQFYSKIDAAFAAGARVVVLGFDDYAHVPQAKAPTQRRRSDHVKALTFHDRDELPSQMPLDWNSAMRNRVFKTKVVSLIARNVAERYKEGAHSLVLDWVGAPQVHGRAFDLPPMLTPGAESGGALRRGECDVKAFAWMHTGMPLLIESTDGDFLPMSLLQLARPEAEGAHVVLHRMKTNIEPPKRGTGGRAKREYEFVHINVLFPALVHAMHGSPGADVALTARVFALLVATTGCDFCMSLPGVGPSKLWALRNSLSLMPGVARERRDELWASRPLEVLLHACIKIYASMHKKHLPRAHTYQSSPEHDLETLRHTYDAMHEQLTKRAIAPLRLPPWKGERMIAHLRNTIWTVEYWSTLHEHPDPMTMDEEGVASYGFARDKGRVVFAGT